MLSCEKGTIGDLITLNELNADVNQSLILKDAETEDAEEVSNYEIDFFTSTKHAIKDFGNDWRNRHMQGQGHGQGQGQGLMMGGRYRAGHLLDITVDSTESGYPKTIALDYGTGTELGNGKVIRGKIIINVSGPPLTNGSVKEISYEDFSIDSLGISGNKVITFIGDNTTSKVFSSTSSLMFTFADGSTMSKTSEKLRQWVSGIDTELDPKDDIIHITGSSSSVRSDGNEMQKLINEALVKTGNCKFITQGIVTFTKTGEPPAVLDYGDGTCDRNATITKDGETKEIILGKKKGGPGHANGEGHGKGNGKGRGDHGNGKG